MSFSYESVEDSDILKKSLLYGVKELVRVKVNPCPEVAKQYPFPSDYDFQPCVLPKKFLQIHDRIHNFKVRPDDVWLVSLMKTGGTMVMNTLSHLMSKSEVSKTIFDKRVWSLELMIQAEEYAENMKDENYVSLVEKFSKVLDEKYAEPSPRLIKSQMPAHLLPKDIWTVKPKILYTYRDIKDLSVSMPHYFRGSTHLGYKGSMEDLFDAIFNDHIIYGPHFSHVNSCKVLEKMDNVLLLKFEDLISDKFAELKKICKFLNYPHSDDELKQLVENTTFDKMKERYKVDQTFFSNGFNFFRKGKSGGYRDEMSPEYIQKFDELERKHQFKWL